MFFFSDMQCVLEASLLRECITLTFLLLALISNVLLNVNLPTFEPSPFFSSLSDKANNNSSGDVSAVLWLNSVYGI